MEAENSETLTVEAIDWPFLKSQRDHDHDNSSPDDSADHYEIVVSNVDDGLHHFSNDDTPGSDSNFETCLISNADLAALTSTPPSASDGIKMEPMKDHQAERVEYDAVQYFADAGLGSADDVIMTDDQQKLIKVYQTAMENSDNKLITVYEIKPEIDEDGTGLGGRDVLVEIVSSPEEHLLRGTATIAPDGTLLIGSPDGNDLHTHLTIPASMAAAMGLTTTSLSQHGDQYTSMSPNSTSGPQTSSTTTTTVAELRCTLCGFVSYSRDEIGAHCEEAHELFLCQACNLVFKRRQSLQSHARAKHGTTFASSRPKNFGMNNRGAGRVTKKITSVSPSTSNMNNSHTTKFYSPMMTSPKHNNVGRQIHTQQHHHHQQQQQHHQQLQALSPDILLQLPTQPLQPNMLDRTHLLTTTDRNNFELLPDIREILAKNKAVMPNLSSTSTGVTTVTQQMTAQQQQQRQKKVNKGKRQLNHNWARTLSQADHPLILDSRLSDPVTRNQFNSEFAKKITSHGIGAEMFGMSPDRLPALRGTFRLDIKERVAENGDVVASSGGASNNETMYAYDIVDVGVGVPNDGCKVICGLCNFSNARIENVLFHCEIDHKQYFCQNKRCQHGFSSWDSLMRHMKNVHRKEKQ